MMTDENKSAFPKQLKILKPRIITNTLFALTLLVIIAINLFSFIQLSKFVKANELVIHSYRAIQSVDNILLNLVHIESAARGYLITHNPLLTEEIEEKKAAMYHNFKITKELTKENPKQQKRLELLEPILEKRMDFIKQILQDFSLNKKLQMNLVSQGNEIGKTISLLISEINAEEFNLLEKRNIYSLAHLTELTHFLIPASLITIFLFLVGIIILNLTLARQNYLLHEKRKFEKLITSIIDGTNDIVVALDLNYRFIIFNRSFEYEFKYIYNRRPHLGASIIDTLSHIPDEQKKASMLWERALSGEEFSIVGEFGSANKNIYECNFNSIYDENGILMGACALCRNIENRIESEKSLKATNEKLEIAYAELKKHDTEVSTLNEMENILQSCSALEEVLPVIGSYCQKLLPFAAGVIYLINPSRNYLEFVTEWNSPGFTEQVFSPNQCWGLRQGKNYIYIDNGANIRCEHMHDSSISYICVPLLAQNDIIGLLQLLLMDSQSYTENETKILIGKYELLIKNLSVQLALAIANIQLRETLKNRSIRDPLTGLYNRAYLSEFLERDLHRAKRNNIPVTIVMMDVDHFKLLNDKYGHDAGDLALKEVGKILKEELLGSDTACRYGGEEFLIILYDTDIHVAYQRIDNLREIMSHIEINLRGTILDQITASFGLAAFPEHGETPEVLITAADEALFQSKKSGRNRVTVFGQNE